MSVPINDFVLFINKKCKKLLLPKLCLNITFHAFLYSFVAHDEELDAKFQAYQVDLLSKICDHVGWNAQPDEPHVTNLLRYVLIA